MAARRPNRAFTLLEMLVASMLTILLALIVARAWGHLSTGLGDCAARARCAEELRLALHSLSRDLGSAVGATPLEAGRLLVCIDGGDQPDGLAQWDQPDQVVEYVVRKGQLIRRPLQGSQELVAADAVEELAVRSLANGGTVVLTLRVRCDGIQRQAELTWSRPG